MGVCLGWVVRLLAGVAGGGSHLLSSKAAEHMSASVIHASGWRFG